MKWQIWHPMLPCRLSTTTHWLGGSCECGRGSQYTARPPRPLSQHPKCKGTFQQRIPLLGGMSYKEDRLLARQGHFQFQLGLFLLCGFRQGPLPFCILLLDIEVARPLHLPPSLPPGLLTHRARKCHVPGLPCCSDLNLQGPLWSLQLSGQRLPKGRETERAGLSGNSVAVPGLELFLRQLQAGGALGQLLKPLKLG